MNEKQNALMVGQQCFIIAAIGAYATTGQLIPGIFDGYVGHSSNVNRRVYLLGSILTDDIDDDDNGPDDGNADTSLRTIKITLCSVLYTRTEYFLCQKRTSTKDEIKCHVLKLKDELYHSKL